MLSFDLIYQQTWCSNSIRPSRFRCSFLCAHPLWHQTSKRSTFSTATDFIFILKKLKASNQKKLVFLLCLMLSSIAETVSIGSIIPFIGFISYPERFWQKTHIQYLASQLNVSQPSDLTLLFALAFFASVFVSGSLRLFSLNYANFTIQQIGSNLGSITFRQILNQPYRDHIDCNSGDVINASLTLIGSFVQLLTGLLSVINSLLTVGFILILLAVVSPLLTFSLLGFISIVYLIIILRTKSQLVILGRQINTSNVKLIDIAQESLGGIREVIVNNLRGFYSVEYERIDAQMRLSLARYQFISQFPRIVVETAALLAVSICCLFITARGWRPGISANNCSCCTCFSKAIAIISGDFTMGLV